MGRLRPWWTHLWLVLYFGCVLGFQAVYRSRDDRVFLLFYASLQVIGYFLVLMVSAIGLHLVLLTSVLQMLIGCVCGAARTVKRVCVVCRPRRASLFDEKKFDLHEDDRLQTVILVFRLALMVLKQLPSRSGRGGSGRSCESRVLPSWLRVRN